MNEDTTRPPDSGLPLRLVAGVIEALRDTTALTWFPFFKEPCNLYFALVPVGLLPDGVDSPAWRDPERAATIRTTVIAAGWYVATYGPGPFEWWIPRRGVRGRRTTRRAWPPPKRVSLKALPVGVRMRLTSAECRAVATVISAMDLDRAAEHAVVDPELTSQIVAWTNRLAGYLGEADTLGIQSTFGEGGLPFTLWSATVVRKSGVNTCYWVDQKGTEMRRHVTAALLKAP